MEEIDPQPVGDVDESGEGDTHPLQNPVVLERIFELIPFELQDFRNFRLVSRAWHTSSFSRWRQNAKLALFDKDLQENEDGSGTRLSRQLYLGLLENNQFQLGQHPFRKYSLKNWKITLQSVNQDGVQDQLHFWNRVGPLMTHLVLETCEFAGIEDLRIVIFQVTSNLQSLSLLLNEYTTERLAKKAERLDPKLPQHASVPPEQVRNNLTEFNIRLLEFNGYLPITWMELLVHFPNIKKIGEIFLGNEAELREFFKSVRILREEHSSHYLANLEDLELRQTRGDSYLGRRLVSYIIRLRLPLKRLRIAIYKTVGEKTLRELLQHPLEDLSVSRWNYGGGMKPFRNFPFGLKFFTLKTLWLWDPIAPNLAFLKDCPNLQLLLYQPSKKDGLDADLIQGLRDVNFPQLECLKALYIIDYLSSAEEIRRLRKLMPNVKHLEIGLDDEGFTVLCEVWSDLGYLRIAPFFVGERALLGMDEQSGEKYRHPNLTDLKNLKVFYTKCHGYQQGSFTDAMILDGLLVLPKLEHLEELHLSPQVSGHVRSLLQKKFPYCLILTQEEDITGGNNCVVASTADSQRNLRNICCTII